MTAEEGSGLASGALELLVFGSINHDVMLEVPQFPTPGETLKATGSAQAIGGKGANQAAAAGLYGAATRMIGALGKDDAGRQAKQALRSAQVDTAAVAELPGVPTGTAYICVRTDGENTIVVDPGANDGLQSAHAEDGIFSSAGWCLLSLEIPQQEALFFAQRARQHGVKVALNASPRLEDELPAGLVDVLIVNEVEAAALVGPEWAQLEDLAQQVGVEAVILTQGGSGALIYERGAAVRHVPADQVQVRDTTGCGDAFAGVMVAALSRGSDYLQAVQQASTLAGRAAEHPGAMASYFAAFSSGSDW